MRRSGSASAHGVQWSEQRGSWGHTHRVAGGLQSQADDLPKVAEAGRSPGQVSASCKNEE